jgi:TetR/AcrR family transcriptional repressor of nem operon
MNMNDTRRSILKKNYEAIHRRGFQGIRTDKVIEELGITKGAFYHYFKNKQELGYAVVDEIIAPEYLDLWRQLDDYEDQPIDGIIHVLRQFKSKFDEEHIKLGDPLNNLIQEMANLDQGFQQRLNRIIQEIHAAISRALRQAGNNLQLASLIEEESLAYFILSSLEGSYSLAKAQQSKAVFNRSMDQLIRYVRGLKR